jgi:hypothetical protein
MPKPPIKPLFNRCILCLALTTLVFVFGSQLSAQTTWNSPADGDWSDGTNWSTGVPNGAGVDAEIGQSGAPYTVTADIDVALNRLTIIGADAKLLMRNRNWTVGDKIQLSHGTIETRGTTTITGDVVSDDGNIEIVGGNTGGNAVFTVDSIVNDGQIVLRAVDSNWAASLAGNVTNNGTFTVEMHAGGNRNFSGTMSNNGSVAINQRLNVNGATSVWNQNAGTLSASEALVIKDGTMNIDGGILSGQVIVQDGKINVLEDSTASGDVQAQGATTLSGKNNNDLHITIQGSNNGGHATATTKAGFVNSGRLTLESIDSNWGSNLDATLGLTNTDTGVINFRTGTGGPRNVFGDIVNQGRIEGDYRQTSGSLHLENAEVVNGNIKVFDTAVTNSGLFTSGEINLHGGDNTLGGNISGSLTARIRGSNDGGHAVTTIAGTLNNDGTLVLDSENSSWSSTLIGNLTNGAGGKIQTLRASGGGRTFDGLITNDGTLEFNANTTITGTGLSMNSGELFSGELTLIDNADFDVFTGRGLPLTMERLVSLLAQQ